MVVQGSDYARLPVIEQYDYLRNVRVPAGIFLSNKVLCARADRFSYYSDESELYDDGSQSPVPSPYEYRAFPTPATIPEFPTSSSHHPQNQHPLPVGSQPKVVLPPIDTLGPPRRPPFPHLHSSPASSGGYSKGYAPLSSEDRRVLDSFRVVL